MATEPDDDGREDDDFLAWWNARKRPTQRILGVTVVVPSPDTVPIEFDAMFTQFTESEDVNDMEQLLQHLFGEGVFSQWKAKGLTGGMLQVLLAWGMSNGAGKPITFDEAAELVAKAEAAKAEGKAPNRAARRASSRTTKSGGTGASSKRTSRASTATARKTSRG